MFSLWPGEPFHQPIAASALTAVPLVQQTFSQNPYWGTWKPP